MENSFVDSKLNVAPGSVVLVRDEEWLVTKVEQATDGGLFRVQGLSELVRDTTASFYEALDDVQVLDPADAIVTADGSSGYRRAKLWVEATLRKTPTPLTSSDMTTSRSMLADALPYQQTAVRQALDPANLRPRILLADAVGLGKTLEIGMILSELVARGRGDRILIVSPRHVLEQIQHEMWTRFALPFVRLDSVGIQRLRQKLPATRNPFTYYKRAIISIDTLKSDKYIQHLRNQRWDAIVIDESHNLTNSGTQNNRLAHILAPTTDALILASATPHNGKPESFAELVRLLEPSAVRPNGDLIEDEVRRLIIRRHRNSPEVAQAVGSDWAPRKEPQHKLIPASAEEDAVADELADTWLHPTGSSPYSGGANSSLFPWTLAKSYLSSPAALRESIRERIRRLGDTTTPEQQREKRDLEHLDELTARIDPVRSGKYSALVDYLQQIGVGRNSPERAVVFAERVATLKWLKAALPEALNLKPEAVQILHGGLTDMEQQEIVESFKLASSPIRVLITGDIASEGVNLHAQCHELIHFDIPWSLIRIEQRNGRIDRYGQKRAPQITTLLLNPSNDGFSGDLRVLTRLLEREQEAHKALGDTASLMGKYDVEAEEDEILRVLAEQRDLDSVVRTVEEVLVDDSIEGFFARLHAPLAPADLITTSDGSSDGEVVGASVHDRPDPAVKLFATDAHYLSEALEEAYVTPGAAPAAGGVSWRNHENQSIVEFAPPADLQQRLDVLPESYLGQRHVRENLKLVTSTQHGKTILADALRDQNGSQWPEAHFLGPLHPVLDWASDRALASLGRNQVFAIRGDVDSPTVVLLGTLTNRRGQIVASTFMAVPFDGFPKSLFAVPETFKSAEALFESIGISKELTNPGPVADPEALQKLIRPAVERGNGALEMVIGAARATTEERVRKWSDRVTAWETDAALLVQRKDLKQRRLTIEAERALAASMAPNRQLVRPLLVVVPQSWETDFTEADA
ncbi:helicase-related protein [Subtercola sp. RTI3]|uniref:helicase-related protein n=1 Tax=Subtercola sp. RTI3 TaxID=3048639 RepID=UPI002B2317A9|nr:helicase-related protein [Subtercola sp. RTI3]MEA9986066.1 helicase-related protein [Subtercola sp. RTI3]